MNTVRVVALTNARLPSRAANNVAILHMCDAFARAGHAVSLFARKSIEPGEPFSPYGLEPSFRVTAYDDPGHRGVRTAQWLQRLRRGVRACGVVDAVYARDLFSLASVADTAPSLIYESHWSPRDHAMTRALLSLVATRRNFRRLITISAALRDELLDLVPRLKDVEILVLPSGASLPSLVAPHSLPHRRASAPQVGYTGHLYPGKGAELLVELARRLPSVDFHLVGGEPDDVSRWRAVAPSNARLHGHRPHREMNAWLAAFDVVVAPYQSAVHVSGGTDVARWMSPLKVIEYMAAGKAMVVSDLSVLSELVRDGENALVAGAVDVDAWVRALRRLIDDPMLRQRLGETARGEVAARYTWQARAASTLRGIA